jgi:hypothetical protein
VAKNLAWDAEELADICATQIGSGRLVEVVMIYFPFSGRRLAY